jgi:hypothetical protein
MTGDDTRLKSLNGIVENQRDFLPLNADPVTFLDHPKNTVTVNESIDV